MRWMLNSALCVHSSIAWKLTLRPAHPTESPLQEQAG